MLAQPAMAVVIVLHKKISVGSVKLTAEGTPKSSDMAVSSWIWLTLPESATVTKLAWKLARWNEVNPTSEKPKFGRGISGAELNAKESVCKYGDR